MAFADRYPNYVDESNQPDRHSFFIGVDLGQASDYTAISILEKIRPGREDPVYHLRMLERPELGTPYPDIADRILEIIGSPKLAGPKMVVVDKTGVGAPVVDMLKTMQIAPVPITITGGNEVHKDEKGTYSVPKRDLVMNLKVLYQNGKIKVARSLKEAQTFITELQNFKIKVNINTGHDSYEAWRENEHDDLVLSVALAAWYAHSHGISELGRQPTRSRPVTAGLREMRF